MEMDIIHIIVFSKFRGSAPPNNLPQIRLHLVVPNQTANFYKNLMHGKGDGLSSILDGALHIDDEDEHMAIDSIVDDDTEQGEVFGRSFGVVRLVRQIRYEKKRQRDLNL